MKRALLVAVAGALLLSIVHQSEAPVRAQTADALGFFKNYFITGDYVVGGVGLRGSGGAERNIVITGVPDGADIVAAFLYWQVVADAPEQGSVGVTFNGRPLSVIDGVAPDPDPFGKLLSTEGTSPCWSSGGGTGSGGGSKKTYTYRADVLRLLPIDDVETGGSGKFIVNTSHTITVPDTGNSNATPTALGASLVVVYRDTSKLFRAIVIYDGGYTLNNQTPTMSQTIKGFYQAAAGTARLTHIVGSGQLNKSETLLYNGSTLATNPFTGSAGVPGENWDNPTFDVPVGSNASEVTTGVTASADCLTWGATIFRTDVVDSDSDGLLDVWETTSGLVDPNGQPLPNLPAMGSAPNRPDIFVQVDYMKTDAATSYGGDSKPAHTHLPPYAALELIGKAFDARGIRVHFDVGANYAGQPFILGTGARGGRAISESVTVCSRPAGAPPWVCQFSGHPGTVGWKTGFLFLRDQVIGSSPPPAPGAADPCDAPGNDGPGQPCERRFDRNRRHMFRYGLFAHAIGLPKSEEPVLSSGAPNPNFFIPRTNTGVGDFPGGDFMVTLGAFTDIDGKPVGTTYMQAATAMHEMGHNLELRHGGGAFEPNCKPTYLSVMNYLYQLRGLWNNSGQVHLDFSDAADFTIRETVLGDDQNIGLRYRIGWYAPYAASYFFGLPGVKIATNHCDGSKITNGSQFVRVDQFQTTSRTDWNANGVTDSGFYTQDVNYNGRTSVSSGPEDLAGFNDWANIRVNQLGVRRNTGGLFADINGDLYVGPLSGDVGRGDLGRGDLGRGDLGRGDLGRGDLGRGDLGRGDLGRGDLGAGGLGRGDLGRGDLGRGDLGGGDYFVNNPYPEGELDFETAGDQAKPPPNEFRACVIGSPNADACATPSTPLYDVWLGWKASNDGSVVRYVVYRAPGQPEALGPGVTWTKVGEVTAVPGQVDYSLIDSDQTLVNGQWYTYFAVAVYQDGFQSGPSQLATILAVKKPQFIGFLSPLKTAGTEAAPSDSGTVNYGSAVPLKWQLKQGSSFVRDLNSLKDLKAVPGTVSGGKCRLPSPPTPVGTLDLFENGPTGNSTYRYDSGNEQFQFNWDSSNANKANCYAIILELNADPDKKATFIRFK